MNKGIMQSVNILAPKEQFISGVAQPVKGRPLAIYDAIQIKAAEYWLKLGEADQALRELEALPSRIWDHGWALKTRIAAIGVLRKRDEIVLTIPFAVLRALDYSGAGFDGLKDKAIQNLGRGTASKLQLQFTERLWNTRGPWGSSTGTTFASCGYQNTWEPTRGRVVEAVSSMISQGVQLSTA